MEEINITPYKEIHGGELSIYDFVQEGYTIPDKVIRYLQTKEPSMFSPGIYMHPFREGNRLLGPYWYGDGKYVWDRDTWKYGVKYHLTLPEEFIEHVMSDAGTQFLEKAYCKADSWYQKIEELEDDNTHMNFLPKDADDIDIEEF